jgi:hypothetical protein
MHNIEDIIASAQSAVAASLRAAFDAGREHQTGELRDKFVAFFEGVIVPFSGARPAAPTPAATAIAEPQIEPQVEPIAAVAEAPASEAIAAEPEAAPASEPPAQEAPAEVAAEPATAA